MVRHDLASLASKPVVRNEVRTVYGLNGEKYRQTVAVTYGPMQLHVVEGHEEDNFYYRPVLHEVVLAGPHLNASNVLNAADNAAVRNGLELEAATVRANAAEGRRNAGLPLTERNLTEISLGSHDAYDIVVTQPLEITVSGPSGTFRSGTITITRLSDPNLSVKVNGNQIIAGDRITFTAESNESGTVSFNFGTAVEG